MKEWQRTWVTTIPSSPSARLLKRRFCMILLLLLFPCVWGIGSGKMSYFDTARVLELFGMEMIKGSFCWGRPWILTQWSRKWRKKKTNFQLSKEGVLNIAVSTQHEKLADSFTGHTGLAFHFLVHPKKRVQDSLRFSSFSSWHRTDFLNLCAFVTFVKLSLPKMLSQFSFGVLSRLQYFQAEWMGVHSH